MAPRAAGAFQGPRIKGNIVETRSGTPESAGSSELCIDDYVALIGQLQHDLPQHGAELAATIADSAQLVRGYEDVKLRGVHAYRTRRAELGYPIASALADLLDQ